MALTDQQRKEVKRWLDSKQWRLLKLVVQQRSHYLCEPCNARAITEPGVEVHHLVPHNGDKMKFFCTPDKLQNQCKKCHLASHGKRLVTIGNDGWPL